MNFVSVLNKSWL